MNASITSSRTEGQGVSYNRLLDDSVRRAMDLVPKKVQAGSDGWQRVLENGNELATAIVETIVSKTLELSRTNQFAKEEKTSTWTYPEEYRGPRSLPDQIAALAKNFPGLDGTQALALAESLPELPEGAEGWFAVPSIDAMARLFFAEVTDPAERYCRAVNLVLEKIGGSRRFTNYRQGEFTQDRFRMNARTAHAIDLLAGDQPGDILLIPAQFGLRHRGRSVRRAREVMSGPEFGIGTFIIGCLLLSHPERLVRWEQLHIDCPGDEFAPGADGRFSDAPVFRFSVGKVRFDTRQVSNAGGDDGSASGFLPQ